MSALRRSVLDMDLARFAEAWPPRDASSVPDAVLLRVPSAADPALPEALYALRALDVGCLLLPADRAGGLPPAVAGAIDALVVDAATEDLGPGEVPVALLVATPMAALRVRAAALANTRLACVVVDVDGLRGALGVSETTEVDALAYARGESLIAAAAKGVDAIGRFAPSGDHATHAAGFTAEAFSFALGFRGGLCRTADEVAACNAGYAPSDAAVDRARRILVAMEEAAREGLGAITLDGRMIDIPFVRLSEQLLAMHDRAVERDAVVAAGADERLGG